METQPEHLKRDEFDAWITVNGAPPTQYGVEYKEDGRETSYWVESIADKEFAVWFRKKIKNEKYYAAKLFLDGRLMEYLIIQRTAAKVNLVNQCISEMKVSATERRRFVFASLELTNDDALLGDPCHNNIGNIKIVLTEVLSLGVSTNPLHTLFTAPDAGKVHERSKKGLGHRINLGPTNSIPAPASQTKLKFISSGGPFTCVFNYRPLAMLQAAEIIPRIMNREEEELPEAKSEPIEVSSDDNDEDGEREKELLAGLQQIRDRKRGKQRNTPPKKKLKTEPTNHFVPGEVIDPTI